MTMRLIVQQGRGGRREHAAQAAQALRLERGLLTIGRGQDCDLVLQDTQVSRRHAELRRHGDQWFLVDLGSTNGTFVGGALLRPNEACLLLPGIPVQIGDAQLTLEEEPSPSLASLGGSPQEPLAAASMRHTSGNKIPSRLVGLARLAVVVGGALLIIGSLLPWIRVEVTVPLAGRILDQIYDGLDSGQAGLFIGMAVAALLLVVLDVVVRLGRPELPSVVHSARASGLPSVAHSARAPGLSLVAHSARAPGLPSVAHSATATGLPSVAIGLGQSLAGVVAAVSAGVDVYRYYQLGTKEFLGISLVDIYFNYLSDEVHISGQFGVYLVAVGLILLIVGGLLRLLSAAWA